MKLKVNLCTKMNIRNLKPKIKKDKIRVLWYSNSPTMPTGFGGVTLNVCKRLAKDPNYEVFVIGEHNYTQPVQFQGFSLLGFNVPGNEKRELQPVDIVLHWVQELKPDIFIALEDTFTLKNQGFLKLEMMKQWGIPFVVYTPFDGGGVCSNAVGLCRLMDYRISMAKFTADVFKEEGFDSDVIWHGTDLEMFCPVNEEKQKNLKIKYGFKPDDFIIFSYMRNSMRKCPQTHIEILARWLENKPANVKAFLHIMNFNIEENDIMDYINRVIKREYPKVIERKQIILSSRGFATKGGFNPKTSASTQEIAEYIQLSDILFSATSGEGFGLLYAEGMSCAKPIITNEYTTPQELLMDEYENIGQRGVLVPYESLITATYNTVHAFINKDKAVEELEKLYNDKAKRKELGKNGRAFAERFLNWEYLVEDWKNVINKIVNGE